MVRAICVDEFLLDTLRVVSAEALTKKAEKGGSA